MATLRGQDNVKSEVAEHCKGDGSGPYQKSRAGPCGVMIIPRARGQDNIKSEGTGQCQEGGEKIMSRVRDQEMSRVKGRTMARVGGQDHSRLRRQDHDKNEGGKSLQEVNSEGARPWQDSPVPEAPASRHP